MVHAGGGLALTSSLCPAQACIWIIDWAPKFLRAKATFETLARDSIEGYYHSIAILGDDARKRLYRRGFVSGLDGYSPCRVLREYAEHGPDHPLSLVQYLDIKTYLVGDILTKVDRASMANSLEVRVPLLDHRLVEWLATMPADLKLANGEGKYILKKVMERRLPREILYRRKKGFAVPLAKWFRTDLAATLEGSLLSPHMLDLGIFDEREIKNLITMHVKGRRDNSAALWSLLMFSGFASRFLR